MPTEREEVEALESYLGGKDNALQLWVSSWEEVVDELLQGARKAPRSIEEELVLWREAEGDAETKAVLLDEILAKVFRKEKQHRFATDKNKLLQTFAEALQQTKAAGERLGILQIADRAHTIYVKDLPEGQQPKQNTFRHKVSGPNKDPEILKMLEESSAVEKRSQLTFDRPQLLRAFAEALQQAEVQGERLSLTQIADRAHTIYVKDLPEGKQPKQKTFRSKVSGQQKDPEILKMLEESGAVEKGPHFTDPNQVRKAFAEALNQAKVQGQRLPPQQIADRAHAIYVKNSPEGKQPSRETFHNKVSGPNKDPEILKKLEESGVVEKGTHFIDRNQVLQAFAEALQQAKAVGEQLGLIQIADRAQAIYVKNVPEGKRPSEGAFRSKVSGKNKDPEILKMLEKSSAVEKQEQLVFDRAQLLQAFAEALKQAKAQDERLTLIQIANRAHAIYVKNLPEAERPKQGTFLGKVSSRKDPEILKMLEESGLIEKGHNAVDREQQLQAFAEALKQAKAQGQRLTPQQIAVRAHTIYVKNVPEWEQPKQAAFRIKVHGSRKDPEILKMLEESGVVERQSHNASDRAQLLLAFAGALQQAKVQGERLNLQQIVDRAHAIYVKDLPESEQPRKSTFHGKVSGSRKDPEIMKMLEESGVMEKRR